MATKTEMKSIAEITKGLKDELGSLVEAERENILAGLVEMAKGMWVYQDMNKAGKKITVRMYQKEPDKEVAQYLLNQFIGKPKQNVEVSGDPDKPLTITFDESFKKRLSEEAVKQISTENEVTSSTTDDNRKQSPF